MFSITAWINNFSDVFQGLTRKKKEKRKNTHTHTIAKIKHLLQFLRICHSFQKNGLKNEISLYTRLEQNQ